MSVFDIRKMCRSLPLSITFYLSLFSPPLPLLFSVPSPYLSISRPLIVHLVKLAGNQLTCVPNIGTINTDQWSCANSHPTAVLCNIHLCLNYLVQSSQERISHSPFGIHLLPFISKPTSTFILTYLFTHIGGGVVVW